MKKLIIGTIVGASLLVGGIVVAHSLEDRVERMQERLALSAEQVESVKKIFETFQQKQEALQKQMHNLRKKTREQFHAILNEEQLKKLEAMKEDRDKRRKHGHRQEHHRD